MSKARSFSKLINKDNYATYRGSDSVSDISAVSLPQGTLNFRNKIINGDMRIDQRNAGSSFTPTDQTYSLDRWKCRVSQASKYTVQQNAGSVTPPAGFTNYLGVTSTSAYSVGTSDYFTVQQIIEGYNIADLGWGTANAKAITISFWVRSSLTGTFGGALMNSPEVRSYPFTYTISSANTWEQKSINIAGDSDTSATWLTTNGIGLYVAFGLGVGLTYSGTAGAWADSSTILSATGATSVVGTSGATFYITGVQLEEGTVATPFEHRPYGVELRLCQRYFCKFNAGGAPHAVNGASIVYAHNYPVTMRVSPDLTETVLTAQGNQAANYPIFSSYGVDACSVQQAPNVTTGINMYVNYTIIAKAEL